MKQYTIKYRFLDGSTWTDIISSKYGPPDIIIKSNQKGQMNTINCRNSVCLLWFMIK